MQGSHLPFVLDPTGLTRMTPHRLQDSEAVTERSALLDRGLVCEPSFGTLGHDLERHPRGVGYITPQGMTPQVDVFD